MAIQTFTASQVLTAAQMNTLQANDYNQTVSTKTASYTLVAADKGTRVVMNAAGATTITVDTSLFSAGDTLVLQNIGAGTTTVTAGTATVSSAGSLAIPTNGSGLLYFTSAGVSIFYPSAVSVSSAVVQVKSTTLTTPFSVSTTQGTFQDITALTVSITPTSASNKVLIFASVNCGNPGAGNQGILLNLTGGNTSSYRGDASGSRTRAAVVSIAGTDTNVATQISLQYLDSPATTSATTYGVAINFSADTGTKTMYVNRNSGYGDFAYVPTLASTITVMEVAP